MANGRKLWLGAFMVALVGVTPSVVPVGGSVMPASASDCSPASTTFVGDGSFGTNGVDYRALVFTATGACDWTVPVGVTEIDLLVIAGGGAGGSAAWGGGGGAGELVEYSGFSTTPGANLSVSVGAGGSTGSTDINVTRTGAGLSTSGSDSSISDGSSTVTAAGGGRGGTYGYAPGQTEPIEGSQGGAGGSGGGSSEAGNAGAPGGSSTSSTSGNRTGYGNPGGASQQGGSRAGAGGGGSGDAGADVTGDGENRDGGDGGAGTLEVGGWLSSITSLMGGVWVTATTEGTNRLIAAGGGGGSTTAAPGAGGSGGGGSGGHPDELNGGAGTPNTGSGGGGASYSGTGGEGGAGGSGLVIVRYSFSTGEILRLDATHPEYDDETGAGKEWNDQAGSLDADAQGDPTYDSRTKAFELDGSGDYFDLPDIAVDFSNGLALHVTADFGDEDMFERLIDFGSGNAADNIFFGREGTLSDRLQFVVYRDSTETGYCYADDAIEPGFHTYSVVIDPDSPTECALYRDGIGLTEVHPTATNFVPRAVTRTSNLIGRSNWHGVPESIDVEFSGSIQSVVMYNTDQVTPTCYPIEDTFTSNGASGESGVSYKTLQFTTVGKCNWSIPTGVVRADAVIVAGGGGGGAWTGAGGGAGGVQAHGDVFTSLSSTSGLTLSGSDYDIAVGYGGAGAKMSGSSTFTSGSNGGDSSIGSSWVAYGGGVGGSWPDGGITTQNPNAGDSTVGSGGGATSGTDEPGSGNSSSFTVTGGRGFVGGDGGSGQPHSAGGGGGAGEGGADAPSDSTSGSGGDGVQINIANSNIWLAGGGGGGIHGTGSAGSDGTVGAGGIGGGGAGSGPSRTDWTGSSTGTTPVGQMGQSATGGGGGGAGVSSSSGYSSTGGDGGSGIVVVRYSLGPGAPAISPVSPGDGSLDVTFSAPSHTGGAAIEDYEYSFDGSTWTSLGTASAGTKTISGLTNGTAYTVRLRAVNGNGKGESVTAGSATTPRGAQTLSWSPTNTSVEVKDGSVTLAPAASALGGVTIVYSVQTGADNCGIADNSTPTVTFSAAGTCVIRATAEQGGAYLAATTDVTLTVSKSSQTITFSSISAKTYGDAAFALTVSSNSALTVTVTPADTSICTVASTTVTIVSVGECSLTASQSGNGSYDAATDVTRTFTISPKAITMTVAIADKTYDGSSAATVSGTPTLSGLVAGDSGYVAVDTGEITAAFANPDAGSSKAVTVTLGDDVLMTGGSGDRSDRYTVTVSNSPTATISKADQSSLSVTSANSMVFGQAIPVVAVGGSGSGDLSYSKVSGPCTVSDSTVTSTGAGSCVITATREADTNYNAVTSSNFTITVSKANQSINFTSTVPVSAVSGTTYTPTATATSGLTVSFAITTGDGIVCSLSSGVVTFSQSGTCVVTASQAGDTDYNAASSVTQTIVAGKINQTITFPAIAGKDFDDLAFSAGASVSSGRAVTYATSTGSVCAVTSSTGVVSIKTVGECTVTASSAGDAAYAAASDVSRTFTISPVLAGKPSVTSVSFGDSSVTVAFVAPGFVGGDAIDGYQVVATSTGGSVTKPDCSTTSPCTITGLTNGDAYTLTVAAINAAGVGPVSAASPSITPARVADAVSGLATTPGDEELAVSWTSLTTSQLGGGDFTNYDIYLRVNGGEWGSAVTPDGTNNLAIRTTNSYTFTGLTNGTAYDVKVVAITSVNSTALSSNTATALGVPATVPDAPTDLAVVAQSNTTALASWSAPLDDGGAVVTAYSVNLSCTFVNATDTFCELSGLTAGSTVTVTVGATNLMGTGSSVSVSVTMPGGSSGRSGGGSPGSQAVVAATDVPVVAPRRVIVPVQPTPVPRLLAAPVRIIPERGFDPSAGAKARVGGQPATVTKKPLGDGGLSVEVGAFQLGIKLSTPGSSELSGAGQRSDIDVPTGQSTKVSGGGLLPGSSLQVWLPGMTGESPRELARIPVQSDGSFASDLSFTSRQSETPIPIGPQVMQVTGYDEQGNQTIVDMVVNIGQGAPAPEPNRSVNELPDLSPGQSLATSAGTPETVTVEATPQTGEVAVLSDEWAFTVTVAEDSGGVEQVDSGATITMVQTKTASVSGEGFQPETRVDIWLFSDPTLLGSVIVAADGSFTGEVYVDARYATPGEHTLQLQGVAEDGFIKAANLGVMVQEPVELTAGSATGLLWWVAYGLVAVLFLVVLFFAVRRRSRRSAN